MCIRDRYNAGLRVGYQPKWGGFDLSGDWRFRHSTNLLRETNNYIRDYSFGLTAYAVFPGNIRLKSETTHTFRNGTNINRSEDNEVVWNLHLSWSFLKYKTVSYTHLDVYKRQDLNRMYEIGNQIKNSIQDIEGVADLNVEQQVERPQLKIEPKREMLAKYGVTLPQFGDIVNVMLGGEAVSQVCLLYTSRCV